MIYRCGHEGCDVCGGRKCNGTNLKEINKYKVCVNCLIKAVELSINMAETFGGIMIDIDKPCGIKK